MTTRVVLHHPVMGPGVALAGGLAAGLAVAMPIGAIGVLLLQEGALRGVRRALPGAAAVASVDALYCALAVLVGATTAPRVASWRPWPALVGGIALLAVAGVGLRRGLVPRRGGTSPDEAGDRARRRLDRTVPDEAGDRARRRLDRSVPDEGGDRARRRPDGTVSGEAGPGIGFGLRSTGRLRPDECSRGPGWRRYVLFVGLTAVNPATLVYFVALMSGPTGPAGRASTAATFVAGVGVASFGWQALLVAGGGLLGARAGPGARRATVVVGNAMVATLGVVTIWRAARP